MCSAHAGSAESGTENIDEIVQDHDNFGTDENEEDSLDSVLASGSDSHQMHHETMSTGNPASIGMRSGLKSGPSSGFKRKSGDEDLTRHNCQSGLDAKDLSTPLIPKRKREMFSCMEHMEHEQEVCLSTMNIEDSSTFDRSQVALNDIINVESIKTVLEPPKEVDNWLDTFSSWSHAQRLCAIDLLIGRCHPTQVRHMMAVIEPQFQRDFISLLPKELALYVLSFLHPRDLLRAAQTCRYWRILAEDNLLWREKCRESGLDDSVTDLLQFRKSRKFHANSSNSQQGSLQNCANFAYSPWKNSYMRQHNIEINWRVRGIRTPKVLKGHDDHVITCLQFCNNRIVSGSDDNTLKVSHKARPKAERSPKRIACV